MQKEAAIQGYELTPQQEQVWQREQLGPAWLWGAVRVKGEVELGRLQGAVRQVAASEEVLRSGFEKLEEVDQPLQVLRAVSGVQVETEASEAEAVWERLRQWGCATWAEGEVEQWGVKLLRVSEGEQVLAVRMRPLCGDGETVRQVLAAVLAAYEGSESEPQRRVQYADYGAWQKEVREEAGAEGHGYWEREQRSERSELRLGLERVNSTGESEWRQERVAVPAVVAEQVRQVAAAAEVSEEAVLLSVWQLLLWRHTEAAVVEVERSVSGRSYEELQGALGRYQRWLPVRVRVRAEGSWRELLRETAARLEETEKWQEYYGGVGEGVRSGRIGFEYVSGGEWEWLEERVGGQKLKLRTERGETLSVELEYDAAELSAAAAAWLSGQYVQLLAAVSSEPAVPVSAAVLVGEREREQVLRGWNETRAVDGPAMLVQQLFELQVERTPEAVALVSGSEPLSYAELNRRANQLAHYLRRQGVGAEVVVGLCVERSVEMVVGLLGILKAGGAYLPLDPGYPRQRLEYLLADAQVGLVLTQERLLGQLPVHWGQTLVLDQEWSAIASESEANPEVVNEAGQLAYVIYTSGSTGQPKGVMITQGGLVNYLQWASATYPFAAGSGSPLHSTLSFDLTVTTLYAPLLVGGWVELLNEQEGSGGLEAAWRERSGYGVVKLTPAHLRLLNESGVSGERLREWSAGVIVGGEALSWEQVREWVRAGVRVYNEYGPTETVVGSSVYEVEAEAEAEASGGVSIGRPIRNTELYVLDQWQQPVAVGVRGEIYIGGVGLARGYWQRAELTAERFVPHPYSATGGERLYRTGDEGRYLEDGRIEYLGRRDQQVKVRGYRIELGEIEAVLESHAGVRQAVVTVREESAGDQRLVGYVVGSWSSEREVATELRGYLRERLPEYMVPQRWVVLEQMPLTANGKIDRANLPATNKSRVPAKGSVLPGNALERKILKSWQSCLKVGKVGVNDNFFDLGGHSLLL